MTNKNTALLILFAFLFSAISFAGNPSVSVLTIIRADGSREVEEWEVEGGIYRTTRYELIGDKETLVEITDTLDEDRVSISYPTQNARYSYDPNSNNTEMQINGIQVEVFDDQRILQTNADGSVFDVEVTGSYLIGKIKKRTVYFKKVLHVGKMVWTLAIEKYAEFDD